MSDIIPPSSKEMAKLIELTLPKGTKAAECIDTDCRQVGKLIVLAWVMHISLSSNQGCYVGKYATVENGEVNFPQNIGCCQYFTDVPQANLTYSRGQKLIEVTNVCGSTDIHAQFVCSHGQGHSTFVKRLNEENTTPIRTI